MDNNAHATVPKPIRVLVPALAIVVLPVLATGWLYLLRGSAAHWPGPRVADALPLDELPGHDRVALVVYVAVFSVAGMLLGLVTRAVRLGRLTAGLALAVGTGAWLLTTDALCLLVVRQVPIGTALQAAARLQPVYIAAALAGAAGALLARGSSALPRGGPRIPDRPEPRNGHKVSVASPLVPWPIGGGAWPNCMTPALLGWLVAAGGVIDIMSALVPHSVLGFGLL